MKQNEELLTKTFVGFKHEDVDRQINEFRKEKEVWAVQTHVVANQGALCFVYVAFYKER